MRIGMLALVLALSPAMVGAQSPSADARRFFEAGQYTEAIGLARVDSAPDVLYVAGQSYQRLGMPEPAAALYDQLAARPAADPWQAIGLSARRQLDGQLDAALAAANDAVARGPMVPEAHYQLGLAQAARQAWPAAAAAFDRAVGIDPRLAYAHYFGGLMYSRANQPAQMAVRFEQFLRLAPEAPERPEVLQIMRAARR